MADIDTSVYRIENELGDRLGDIANGMRAERIARTRKDPATMARLARIAAEAKRTLDIARRHGPTAGSI